MARWNEKSRKRQAELVKGWKPWEKGGVKTSEGKVKSSQNAFKHGGRSAEIKAMRQVLRECAAGLKVANQFLDRLRLEALPD